MNFWGRTALSIQAVSTRRHNLPIPTLDLSSIQNTTSTLTRRPSNAGNPSSPTTPYRNHKMSLGSQQSDPWGAPTSAAGPSQTNDDSSRGSDDPFVASPSRYSIGSTQPPMYSPPRERGGTAQHRGTDNNGYSSFPTYNDEGGLMEESSSTAPHNESSNSTLLSLPPFISSSALSASQEKIKIIQMEELQGNFLTRYTVYKVYCEKRASEVLRRYSDWNWLESYLDTKYPARIRLNLPPKRMGSEWIGLPLCFADGYQCFVQRSKLIISTEYDSIKPSCDDSIR